MAAWMATHSGRKFDPLEPDPADISIVDIAHALSQVCRFNGHTRVPYSVAQHSVHVAAELPEHSRLWGLLHDASEAYLGDMILPLKASGRFDTFKEAEDHLQAAIFERFGLTGEPPAELHTVDRRMVVTEARDLMDHHPDGWIYKLGVEPFDFTVQPWAPATARTVFLEAFRQLALATDNIQRGAA